MLKIEGVLHFTIPVKDLDRSEKFYRDVLNFQKINRTDRIVFMRAGNFSYSENLFGPPIITSPDAAGREIKSAACACSAEWPTDDALRILPATASRSTCGTDRRVGDRGRGLIRIPRNGQAAVRSQTPVTERRSVAHR